MFVLDIPLRYKGQVLRVRLLTLDEGRPYQISHWGSCTHGSNARRLKCHLEAPREDGIHSPGNRGSPPCHLDPWGEICHVSCSEKTINHYHKKVYWMNGHQTLRMLRNRNSILLFWGFILGRIKSNNTEAYFDFSNWCFDKQLVSNI